MLITSISTMHKVAEKIYAITSKTLHTNIGPKHFKVIIHVHGISTWKNFTWKCHVLVLSTIATWPTRTIVDMASHGLLTIHRISYENNLSEENKSYVIGELPIRPCDGQKKDTRPGATTAAKVLLPLHIELASFTKACICIRYYQDSCKQNVFTLLYKLDLARIQQNRWGFSCLSNCNEISSKCTGSMSFDSIYK